MFDLSTFRSFLRSCSPQRVLLCLIILYYIILYYINRRGIEIEIGAREATESLELIRLLV